MAKPKVETATHPAIIHTNRMMDQYEMMAKMLKDLSALDADAQVLQRGVFNALERLEESSMWLINATQGYVDSLKKES